MKKKVLIVLLILIMIFFGLFFVGGLRKRTDVVLRKYSLSEDGTRMKLDITVASTVGYARDLKVKQGGDNKYITFYSTFGFLNSKFGAKSEYEIELDPSCTEIYFYKGNGEYKLVLQQNEKTNEWELVG